MTIQEQIVPHGTEQYCGECVKRVPYRMFVIMVGDLVTKLCVECMSKLRHELSVAAYPAEGITIRMNRKDDGTEEETVDEVYADRAFIGFEQMSYNAYWLTVQKDGARLDIDFVATRREPDPSDPFDDDDCEIRAVPREQYVG